MKIESSLFSTGDGWVPASGDDAALPAQLLLLFGDRGLVDRTDALDALRARYPDAAIVGCSSAGQIRDTSVVDDCMVATAIQFEGSTVREASTRIRDASESERAGEQLAEALSEAGLVHVLVFAEGLGVNGSSLLEGMSRLLPPSVTVTGGMAADGERFERTLVVAGGRAHADRVVAIGLYGERLRVGFGSMGGWDTFGPERRITRASGNVLYELDGEPALELYARYLGPHALELPASGLLFPLSLRSEDGSEAVVRTIVGIDREQGSLTFVGGIPEGARGRLMRANLDRLIDGASGAASRCHEALAESDAELALLISCVGRRLVLKHRTEEEIERVREVLGARPVLCGFYSYGEIAPFVSSSRCELHNQTMTITTLTER